ncbi:MAG: hypothetical protein JJT76_06270 [Clostridiaceae bacterium]|nr:hypothetical protein [Clostridiaceae bacterium]
MRKLLCLSIAAILVMLNFVGCTTKSLPTSAVGQWSLEMISDTSGEILIVGKAYNGYNDFNGRKKDIKATFNEDGTFQIAGSEENLQGEYNSNEKHRTADAIAINMYFDDGTKSMASLGIRQYRNDKEVNSLIFTVDNKIYSFIKSTAN